MALVFGGFFVQVVFLFGFLILYGMLISFFNNCFYAACGDKARGIVKLTGYIGLPVHELSHALMCVLFGHSVKKIELFNQKKRARILGYVEHTYYKDNPYHQIGNFFIGVSPIVAGGGVILLLLWLLVPSLFSRISGEIASLGGEFAFTGEFFGRLLDTAFHVIKNVFALSNFKNPFYWLCLVLIFAIAIHMEISTSDIVSGARGLLWISGGLLIADLVLGLLFPNAMLRFTSACVMIGIYEGLFLLIPAIFTALIGCISLIVLAFREMFR